MIDYLAMTSSDEKAPDPQRLSQLLADLELVSESPCPPPPEGLRADLFRRLDAEPARVETDLKGRITAINPAFSRLCGYSFPEICGRKPGSFLQGSGTDPDQVKRMREALAATRPVEAELTNYHKDGSAYQVQIKIEPRLDGSSGQVVGFAATEKRVG